MMKFEEIDEEENINIFYGTYAFYDYWMDETDPRQTKTKAKKQFDFEQSCGSGDWDY